MSDSGVSQGQLKVKVINLIELAYKENKGITTSLIREKGPFSLKISDNGDAMLTGKAGVVRFSAKEEIKSIGLELKAVSIMFSGAKGGKIRYLAAFKFAGSVSIEFTSLLDIENLILSCSGLLCRAARLMKERHQRIDSSIF